MTPAAVKIRQRRKRYKEYRDQILQKGCEVCSETRIHVLDFHHCKGIKDGEIGKMIANLAPWNKFITEIKKCMVVCANCHRDIHFQKRQTG